MYPGHQAEVFKWLFVPFFILFNYHSNQKDNFLPYTRVERLQRISIQRQRFHLVKECLQETARLFTERGATTNCSESDGHVKLVLTSLGGRTALVFKACKGYCYCSDCKDTSATRSRKVKILWGEGESRYKDVSDTFILKG